MPDLFPVEEGELKVVDLTGAIQPLALPEGVSALAFRTIVSAIHTSYLHTHSLPQFDELIDLYPRIRSKDLLAAWESEELATALRYRGLEWGGAKSGLTLAQEHLIMALSDPTDKRAQNTKLRSHGVSGTTFRTWMKNPLFAERMHKSSIENYTDFLPLARNALVENATSGDQRAIELLFQITGEWSPETEALGDLRLVVQNLVESVIRNVHDPEAKKAILSDAEAALSGFRLRNQKSIGPANA